MAEERENSKRSPCCAETVTSGAYLFRNGSFNRLLQWVKLTTAEGDARITLRVLLIVLPFVVLFLLAYFDNVLLAENLVSACWQGQPLGSLREAMNFGTECNRAVRLSLLLDLAYYTNFLVPVVLMASEVEFDRHMNRFIQYLEESSLVPTSEREKLIRAITKLSEHCNAKWPEVAATVLAIIFSVWLLRGEMRGTTETYLSHTKNGSLVVTRAGVFGYLVIPAMVDFSVARWGIRYLWGWCVFLWRISRIRLRLNALHPDRAGGIGYLGVVQTRLSRAFLTMSLCAAAAIFSRLINHAGYVTAESWVIVLGFPLLVPTVLAFPLLVFRSQLQATRDRAIRALTVGALAALSDRDDLPDLGEEPTLPIVSGELMQKAGSYGRAYELVKEMHTIPIDFEQARRSVFSSFVPLLSLLLRQLLVQQG